MNVVTTAESPAGTAAAAEPALPTREIARCAICDGADLRPLGMTYEFRGRFPAVECRRCHLRFLSVQPRADALAELYSPQYFERDFRCGRVAGSSFDEDAFREENRGLLDEFTRWTAPGRLLEVGCAGGWLLKHAIERGWQAQGVELSKVAADHARSLWLDVHHGDLMSAHLPAASFNLVYMGDVLEHVPDCRAVVSECARVLKPGGLLFLRGPVTTNSLARSLALGVCRVTGRTITLREPPYHLWEFTPRTLARLLEACGFEVVFRRQSKIAPGRPHGDKSAFERAAMAMLDAVNVPLTAMFNARGDRIVMVGRTRR
jgi:SAM-dependent methyltransferase